MKHRMLTIALLLAFVLLAGCGKDTPDEPPPDTADKSSCLGETSYISDTSVPDTEDTEKTTAALPVPATPAFTEPDTPPFTVTGGDGTVQAYYYEADADRCTCLTEYSRADSDPYIFVLSDYLYDADGKILPERKNVRLTYFDPVTGTFAPTLSLDTDAASLSTVLKYTETGERLLYNFVPPDGSSQPQIVTAWLIRMENGVLTAEKTETDANIIREYRCFSPDGEWVAYDEHDRSGNGGMYVARTDGTFRTCVRAHVALDYDNPTNIGVVSGARPVCFTEDGRLVYKILGWEWALGYGIYDPVSGEETEYNVGYTVEFMRDGLLYGRTSESYTTTALITFPEGGEQQILATKDTVSHPALAPVFQRSTDREVFCAAGMLTMPRGEKSSYTHAYVFSPDLQNLRLEITMTEEFSRSSDVVLTEDSLILIRAKKDT